MVLFVANAMTQIANVLGLMGLVFGPDQVEDWFHRVWENGPSALLVNSSAFRRCMQAKLGNPDRRVVTLELRDCMRLRPFWLIVLFQLGAIGYCVDRLVIVLPTIEKWVVGDGKPVSLDMTYLVFGGFYLWGSLLALKENTGSWLPTFRYGWRGVGAPLANAIGSLLYILSGMFTFASGTSQEIMLSIGMPELLGTAFFLAAPLLSLVDLEGIYHVRFTAQRQSQRGIRLMCAVVVAKMCLMRFRERHRSGAASLIQQAFRTHLAYQGKAAKAIQYHWRAYKESQASAARVIQSVVLKFLAQKRARRSRGPHRGGSINGREEHHHRRDRSASHERERRHSSQSRRASTSSRSDQPERAKPAHRSNSTRRPRAGGRAEAARGDDLAQGGVERGTSGHVLPSTHVVHFVKTWRQRHARRLRERQAAARAIQRAFKSQQARKRIQRSFKEHWANPLAQYSQQHQHYMVQRRMHEPLWSAQHTGLGRDTREGSEEARTPLVVESYTSDLEEDLEQRNSVTGRRIRDRIRKSRSVPAASRLPRSRPLPVRNSSLEAQAAGVVVESDCVSSFRAACHGASEAESTVGETETDGFLSSTPFELGRAPASDGEARYWLSDTEADTDREVDSMMDMALTHRIQAALRTRGLSITNK
ncbi:hypothetical protein CYMTET_55285 [Cymbomonas tetramitiformis]|uniref:Uncharacterized protein n=1 Tax=Cymbomonas tetramitiformis TaxID=36881 RepID=A0AAE0BDA9_9CHLO|nr:hypothetical protein CYMTET_55285 [Cymbomonas tetramitiformis]